MYIIVHASSCSKQNSILAGKDPGAFYKYINNKLNCKSGVAAIKLLDGSIASSDFDKSEILNNHFANSTRADDGHLPNFTPPFFPTEQFDSFNSSSFHIASILKKIKPSLAIGPDGLPAYFFKQLNASLALPFSLLFSKIFETSTIPSVWSSAVVTPIFKKGFASDPDNYRPISILCCGLKVLEACIKKDLMSYLTSNELITPTQHGFLTSHSTTTNLLQAANEWTLNYDRGHFTRVIYIDFKKAFDTVSHPKLLYKLKIYGFSDRMLALCKALICNRVQRVSINESLSTALPLSSGVAQGSILGPILFTLYINDLPSAFSNEISNKIFADDLKIYASITNDQDMINLQLAQ